MAHLVGGIAGAAFGFIIAGNEEEAGTGTDLNKILPAATAGRSRRSNVLGRVDRRALRSDPGKIAACSAGARSRSPRSRSAPYSASRSPLLRCTPANRADRRRQYPGAARLWRAVDRATAAADDGRRQHRPDGIELRRDDGDHRRPHRSSRRDGDRQGNALASARHRVGDRARRRRHADGDSRSAPRSS